MSTLHPARTPARRPRRIPRLLVGVLSALLGAALVGSLAATAAEAGSSGHRPGGNGQTVQVPVSFTVKNVNRSLVACATDGQTYTVRGKLIAPAGWGQDAGRKGKEVTLYLHGLSFGEFFYDFQQASDYNYAQAQARQGNASVVVDRLGYGASDKPDGNQICVGSRADIAHQMVVALKSGGYDVDGRSGSAKFDRVVLAGHSYGGQIVQVEAYSFGDIDGLIVLAYSDRVQSDLLRSNAAYAAKVCASGGLKVGGTGPGGYAPFGPPSGALSALFNSAPQRVQLAAKQLLTLDPCGDTASFNAATKVDLANVATIKVPVLVVGGGADKLFPPPAAQDQAALLTGSRSVRAVTLPDTAHALTLEAGRGELVRAVDRFLGTIG